MSKLLQKTAEIYKARGHLDPEGFNQHVQFITYPSPADLALFVDHFWVIRWDAPIKYESEEVMHRPYTDLFISAKQSGIQGTFRGKRTYEAVGKGRIIGCRFRPGGLHAFWPGVMSDLQDKDADLVTAFPEADYQFVKQLISLDDTAAITEIIRLLRLQQPKLDTNIELINAIIAAVENDESLLTVSAVARATGRSERWLQQLFSDYVGVGLKWLLQRHKLLAAAEKIQELDRPDWAAIAYDLGYSSQQHFIADFKKVLGKTPVQYKKGLTTPSA